MDGLRATVIPNNTSIPSPYRACRGQGVGGRKGQTHQQKYETSTEAAAY